MEGDATAQLAAVSTLPGCVRAVGMPDLHPGRGFPIGAVVATRGVVYPHLVGGDAGCGARLVATNIDRVSPDRLERRLRSAFEDSLFESVDAATLFEQAWFSGPRGLAEVDGLPDGLRNLAAREPEDGLPTSGSPTRLRSGFESALGTIGGGNHFAEVSRVSQVLDTEAARRLGIEKNVVVALVHSGSRGLGAALSTLWGTRPIHDADVGTYLGELAGACRFASANRFVLAYRLLVALGAVRDSVLRGAFDVTHNDLRKECVAGLDTWIHRKGAAPAYDGTFTVVLGSRGAPSWIMQGSGNETGLRSIAHGAGRKMGRSEAREKIRARYRRSEVSRSPGGGRVVCDDKDLLFEEHPDAYKAIEPIIAALETHSLAARVAALTPVITVKI
jgi:release factor H-coupled RctB family protein